MKFKVGDRVKAIKLCDGQDLIGKIGKVISLNKQLICVEFDENIGGHDCCGLGKDLHCRWCEEESLKLLVNKPNKLIFRDNATILIKDGKRYVTKCDKDDFYDREKGLLVALAKANGIKYADIQKMLENAEIQCVDMQLREVNRPAKIGEYIKVVHPLISESAYNKGDICKVLKRKNGGVFCKTKDTHSFNIGENTSFLFDEEYVVLENYKPKAKESK